ncbi:MAG: hypothetical protein P8J32_06535 [bacterium]|nr:hypothetical protein [bacterium]
MQRRNIGMTRFLAHYAAWRLVFGLDENILIILPTSDARRLFHKQLSIVMEPIINTELRNKRTYRSSQNYIELGSNRVRFIVAGKHAGRGEMPSLVIMKGFGVMRDAQDIWTSISGSMSMGQSDCIITNPWGTELGFFGEMWKSALKGDADFTSHYI